MRGICYFGRAYRTIHPSLQKRRIDLIGRYDGRSWIELPGLGIVPRTQIEATELIINHAKSIQYTHIVRLFLPGGLKIVQCPRIITTGNRANSGLVIRIVRRDGFAQLRLDGPHIDRRRSIFKRRTAGSAGHQSGDQNLASRTAAAH